MRYVVFIIALLMLAGCCALADDIVTMPSANQLKAGQVDVAAYYLKLDLPSAQPQHVNYETVYVGLTDRLELDGHIAAVDKDRSSTVLVGTYKLLGETKTLPDMVVGCRNLTDERTTDNPAFASRSEDRSYFVSAAKTFFLNPAQPGAPLVRAHLSLGTQDWTLLGEVRHRGVFGGLQFLITPTIGAVVENDGQDTITGLTFMPKNTGLTIKGGTYGSNWWAGMAFRKAW